MKICFVGMHQYYGGINNNGGSRTILLSVQTLRDMGHTAEVAAICDNFTWFKHDKVLKKIPEKFDAYIACSVSDIDSMAKIKNGKKLWWCRLLENYQMPKISIIKRAKKVKTLVNSESLKDFFSKNGVKTHILYQGIDTTWNVINKYNDKPTIGFLLSNKPRKRLDIVKNIVKLLGDKYDYAGYCSKNECDEKVSKVAKNFTHFKKSPDHNELNDLYNLCDIWCSVSDSEGLHNPPIEAALCGCELVCNGAKLSGTKDYAIDGKTAWVFNDIVDAVEKIKQVDYSRNLNCRNIIYSKIGTREQNMRKLLELI